jgi:hypothetical protein
MAHLTQIILHDRQERPLQWPAPDRAGGFQQFERAADWRAFIENLAIDRRIPDIVQAKFKRAQALHLVSWGDLGLVTAGELAALIALEVAVMDRYGSQVAKNKRNLAAMLKHMVDADGLTDADIPTVSGNGTAIGQLTGDTHPTLAERRNRLAHGDPFEGLPTRGLLELVRDLINYAYRGYIADVATFEASR